MKVLLVNGSPNKNGCTYTALDEIKKTLAEEGIEADSFQLGKKPVGGCIACYQCVSKGKCVFDDAVNEFTELAKNYDEFIFGSPVYYSGMNGSLMSFMDRVFFSASSQEPHPFRYKPAAAVVSARRAGTTSAIDQINKYFLEQQEITEQMLKILDDQENATTSEILGCKESIKNFREAMKKQIPKWNS